LPLDFVVTYVIHRAHDFPTLALINKPVLRGICLRQLKEVCSCGTRERHMSSDPSSLPRHVSIIMDGNGRWAQLRGLPRIEGHRRGAVAVREVVRAAREIGVRALTLYAFCVTTSSTNDPRF
jgi:undecaprenyl pyrophosphate synthase